MGRRTSHSRHARIQDEEDVTTTASHHEANDCQEKN
jgi:hypothetical protein